MDGHRIADPAPEFLQIRAFQLKSGSVGHELAHIFCGHFETFGMNPDQREKEANKKAWEYYDAYIEGRL